ncbi:MAG: class IV adenylate cyclase [Terriglobales bacterium]
MPLESELKFLLAAPAALRSRLRVLGFRVSRPRQREQNWLFDDARGSLRAAGKLLRLRRSGRGWLLTAKGPRRPGVLKRRLELQSALADGRACRALLALLGFRPTGSYALTRTLLRRPGDNGELAWDETAKGVYLEIEGSARWVRQTARQLNLTPAQSEPRSYPEILNAHRPRGRKSKERPG